MVSRNNSRGWKCAPAGMGRPGIDTPHPAWYVSPMSDRPQAVDVAARVLGLLVFLLGVGLIVWVFRQADQLFHAPPLQLPTPTPAVPKGSAGAVPPAAGEALGKAAAAVGADLATTLSRLLSLILMAVAGGLTASLGIRLVGALRRNL